MNLAVFDIDGTLTSTNAVDTHCFVRAWSDAHSIKGIDADWSAYSHTTDSCISLEIFKERTGRPPDDAELERLKSRFVTLLKECHASDPKLFGDIPGASRALKRLAGETGWAVAFATGSWRASACMKLEAAGVEHVGIPAAFAEDALSREGIVNAAVSRALEAYGQARFGRVVSVGDGIWDVSAAARLGVPFVGVAAGRRAAKLRRAGATHLVEDYVDYEKFVRCLSEAGVPGASSP